MNGGALERLISDARRRFAWNLTLDQSSIALAFALAAAIVLILAGTQILHWFWPAALFAGALAYGFWRVRARMPEPYAIAQRLDRALGLHDSLSTAWHFRNTSVDVFSEEVKAAQHEQAERHAAEANAATAFPYRAPKSLRWSGVLGLAVVALLVARYGVQKSLDLSRPLVAFDLDSFGSSIVEEATNRKKPRTPKDDVLKTLSVQPPEQAPEQGLDPAPDSALGTVDVPDVNNDNSESANRATSEKGPGTGDSQEKGESAEEGEGASSGDPNKADNNQGAVSDGKNTTENPKGQQTAQAGENSSMMDKMRDALANLMSKLNQQNNKSGDQSQQAQNSKTGQPSGNARQQAKQGMQGKGQQSSEQQQASDQQGNQDMQDADPSQATQGKPGDRNSQQASNQENKSGMGKQDGDKDVKLAEQLEAMGKISEIIGKRNANLQGEIMVEVNSAKQNLKTQYSQQSARHAEAGGEIRRDEVPLIFQSYVQQYFEEVRKAPVAPPAAVARPKSIPPKPTVAETP